MYIADTNVLSETNKKRVNTGVQACFRQVELDGQYPLSRWENFDA